MKITPAFIIHSSCCPERDELVEMLRDESEAEVVEAVWDPQDPKRGCRESHKKIAQMAKDQYPEASYLVFEDDCEFVSPRWYYPSIAGGTVDLIYLGVNGYGMFEGQRYSYGTHAMIISPKVRDLILSETDKYIDKVYDKGAFDHILNKICYDNQISIWRPPEREVERWVRQKKGIKSTITGNLR